MSKRYRLLKDLPNAKAGEEYAWHWKKNLIAQYDAYYNTEDPNRSYFLKEYVENNPERFS